MGRPENRGVLAKLSGYLNQEPINASKIKESQGGFGEPEGDEEMRCQKSVSEKHPKPHPEPISKNSVKPMGLISSNRSEGKENSLRESIVINSQPYISAEMDNFEDKE